MPGSVGSIVALHHTQKELAAARASLDGIPEWMAELDREHRARRDEIAEVETQRDAAARERRQAEGELGDAQERLRHFQSQISRVSTQREYGALLKEIDTVKSQIAEHERRALEALEHTEASQARLDEMSEAFRELDERHRGELAKWEVEKPAVAARVGELEARLAELRKGVPRNTLVLFERLWQRTSGDAVARVVRVDGPRGSSNRLWHCSACSYSIRPQIVVDVRNGGIHQCDACKRILYWEEESETEALASASA